MSTSCTVTTTQVLPTCATDRNERNADRYIRPLLVLRGHRSRGLDHLQPASGHRLLPLLQVRALGVEDLQLAITMQLHGN